MCALKLPAWPFALAIILAVGFYTNRRVGDLQEQVQILINEDKPMSFTWTTAGEVEGTTAEVVLPVPRNPEETVEAWAARARTEFVAMQALFPPV